MGKMCYFEVTVEQMGIRFELKTEMAFHHDDFEKSSMLEAFFPIFLSYGHCLSIQCTPWICLRDMNVHYVETEILSW